MLIQIINNEITRYSLPITGILKDGRTVTGYHLLDEETLREEGWLPLEDIQPSYDNETQYLVNDGYEILADKVVVKYIVEDIIIEEPIPPMPSEIDILKEENEKLKTKLYEIEAITTEASATQEMLIELLLDLEVM